MEAGEIFQEIERLMLLLSPDGRDRLKLIGYQAMVKAVRVFKQLVKRQDYKETTE